MIKTEITDECIIMTYSNMDESGWMIKCYDDNRYDVYEIPMYGGQPVLQETSTSLVKAVNLTKSFI